MNISNLNNKSLEYKDFYVMKMEDAFKNADYIAAIGGFNEKKGIVEFKKNRETFVFAIKELLKNDDIKNYIEENINLSILYKEEINNLNLSIMSDLLGIIRNYLEKSNKESSNLKFKNNIRKTKDLINRNIKEESFDWFRLSSILNVGYEVNEDNFDKIFDFISNYSVKRLKNIYNIILKEKKNIKKNNIDLETSTDIIIENIEEIIEDKKDNENNLKGYKKEKEIYEKRKIAEMFQRNLYKFNDFVKWVKENSGDNDIKRNIGNFKKEFCLRYNDIVSLYMDEFNETERQMYMKWNKIKYDMQSLGNLYEDMEEESFLLAIKNNRLLGDIYEFLLETDEYYILNENLILEEELEKYKKKPKLKL